MYGLFSKNQSEKAVNVLEREKQALVVSTLNGCSSVRAVQRVLGGHPVTTLKLLVRVGKPCQRLRDDHLLAACGLLTTGVGAVQ